VVSSPPKEPLSQNLFPIELSRNCPPDLEKRESCVRLECPVSGSCSPRLNDREGSGAVKR